MRVKPAPGRAVRDPHTMSLLPDAGREVKDSDPFWRRRLRDGDVIVDSGETGETSETSETQPQYASAREA